MIALQGLPCRHTVAACWASLEFLIGKKAAVMFQLEPIMQGYDRTTQVIHTCIEAVT